MVAPGDWSIATRDIMISSLKRAIVEELVSSPTAPIMAERKELPGLKVLFRGAQVLMTLYSMSWLKGLTASCDFGKQGQVMLQMRSLTGRGFGLIFTKHDPNQAMRYADRVALLGGGC
jgi:iron complex transport system ATP-binding protein